MDNFLQRALDAPDYLTFLHIIEEATKRPDQPAFTLVLQLCLTLDYFLIFE